MTAIDWTKPNRLRTRDGRSVRVLATDIKSFISKSICVCAPNARGFEDVYCVDENGKHTHSGNTSPYDIVEVPEITYAYANEYEGGLGGFFNTKERAQVSRSGLRKTTAVIKFKFVDGKLDSFEREEL